MGRIVLVLIMWFAFSAGESVCVEDGRMDIFLIGLFDESVWALGLDRCLDGQLDKYLF